MEEGKIEIYDQSVGGEDLQSNLNETPKKVILGLVPGSLAIFFIVNILDSGPGEGSGLAIIVGAPIMLFLNIFVPVYFVILALRYNREKSRMNRIDKINFCMLTAIIFSLLGYVFWRELK